MDSDTSSEQASSGLSSVQRCSCSGLAESNDQIISYNSPSPSTPDDSTSDIPSGLLAIVQHKYCQKCLRMGVHASGKHLSAISGTFSRSFQQGTETDQSNKFHEFSHEKNGSKVGQAYGKILQVLKEDTEDDSLNTTFDLKPFTFGTRGIQAVCATLMHFPDCTRVNLSGNLITESTLHNLAQNLQKLKRLKHLELSNTGLGACNSQSVCRLIQNASNVEYIDLSHNAIKDSAAESILDCLQQLRWIQNIQLHHNLLGISAAEGIRKLLASVTSLKILNCSWNQFRADAVASLVSGMKDNYGLEELSLAWNGLADLGALAIGNALKYLNQLRLLNLEANRIGTLGLVGLFVGLAEGGSLVELYLGHNPIPEQAVISAVEALAYGMSHTTLMVLNITTVKFSQTMNMALNELRKRRPKFKFIDGYSDNYRWQ
ncbi:hypothetical protein EG68_02253 [Paragonimus skrjabini miyazakii]|uniref:Uncharacterized protein n=1 Tax=Paragonimus skrjabini miyazakii TaxID=59628 RepID=A0A8S9Z8C6_9TREM|nr:hypothetical protein EG68_02253 [Paragonimus skrjabini miyazakii]